MGLQSIHPSLIIRFIEQAEASEVTVIITFILIRTLTPIIIIMNTKKKTKRRKNRLSIKHTLTISVSSSREKPARS